MAAFYVTIQAKNAIDKRGPMFGHLLRRAILYEPENMYTVNVRAGLEAEKEELLPNPTDTSLNAICLLLGHGFLTHTYFPSLSSKRPGVKM